MAIEITITMDQTSITLGNPVTVTYNCTGAFDTQIQADNMANPIDLGGGDVSGTIKFLPVMDGDFNVSITGTNGTGYTSLTQSVACVVN